MRSSFINAQRAAAFSWIAAAGCSDLGAGDDFLVGRWESTAEPPDGHTERASLDIGSVDEDGDYPGTGHTYYIIDGEVAFCSFEFLLHPVPDGYKLSGQFKDECANAGWINHVDCYVDDCSGSCDQTLQCYWGGLVEFEQSST